MVIVYPSSRFYSILEPRNEGLVVNECVRSSSEKKGVCMDKERDSGLKLKVVGTLKTPLIVFAFAVSMFSLELGYVHTRDSSRTDSTSFSASAEYCFPRP